MPNNKTMGFELDLLRHIKVVKSVKWNLLKIILKGVLERELELMILLKYISLDMKIKLMNLFNKLLRGTRVRLH